MSSYRFRELQQSEVLLGLQTLGGDLGGGRGQARPLKSELFNPNSVARTILFRAEPILTKQPNVPIEPTYSPIDVVDLLSTVRWENASGCIFCSFSNAMSSLGPSGRSRQKSLPPFRSDLGSAAVNEQFDTRDETAVISSQKPRHLTNFLGLPHASHRDGGHNPRNHVCRLPTRQWRIDRTRTNNV